MAVTELLALAPPQNSSGIGSNLPQTVVACAILYAHEELRNHPRFKNYSMSELSAERLRKVLPS